MAEYSQLPGELNINVGLGDDLVLNLDFDISLVGYVFIAKTISAFDGSETEWGVSGTNLAAGHLMLSLTDSQITTLGERIHRWYLLGTTGTYSRRYLAGNFEVKAYP